MPKGQLSLYLDEHEVFGPLTKWGKIINNILLLFYFTYYLVPYVFIFTIFLRKCVHETIYKYKNNGTKSITFNDSWSKLFFVLSVICIVYSPYFVICFQILLFILISPSLFNLCLRIFSVIRLSSR